jgi:hypothetical protein
MLSLYRQRNNRALVSYESELKDQPEITDWSVDYSTFTEMRIAYLSIPSSWDELSTRRYLQSRPQACIYNIVAHSPLLFAGDKLEDIPTRIEQQRIVIEGKPYIDMFGLYVYITSRIAWDKRSDVDLRFSSNQYPYHHLDSELEMILASDYDILNRQCSADQ